MMVLQLGPVGLAKQMATKFLKKYVTGEISRQAFSSALTKALMTGLGTSDAELERRVYHASEICYDWIELANFPGDGSYIKRFKSSIERAYKSCLDTSVDLYRRVRYFSFEKELSNVMKYFELKKGIAKDEFAAFLMEPKESVVQVVSNAYSQTLGSSHVTSGYNLSKSTGKKVIESGVRAGQLSKQFITTGKGRKGVEKALGKIRYEKVTENGVTFYRAVKEQVNSSLDIYYDQNPFSFYLD